MPGEPSNYTDIGGGGDLKPHGEDFFNRITDVHWRKKATPMTGGVFVAGDYASNIWYIDLSIKGEKNDAGDPVWQNLGTLDFTKDEGELYTGSVMGSACGQLGQAQEKPVFVLVGGGNSSKSIGIILASRDGLSWDRVFSFGEDSDTFGGAQIFGVVWDGSTFWAGGNVFNSSQEVILGGPDGETVINTITTNTETDVLFSSSTGFNWSEVGRVSMNEVHQTLGNITTPYPPYPSGLLASHCSDTVKDSNGNGVPGGVFGYDKDGTGMLIAPNSPPAINYLFGYIDYTPSGVNVETPGAGEKPPDPGLPTNGVATAGGAWIAAGGILPAFVGGPGGTCDAAVLVPVGDKPGTSWQELSPGGSSAIITICGGVVKPSS